MNTQKIKLGEVRVRDRDVRAGACPRDENTAAGEGENREGETKGREVRNKLFGCRDGGRTR